MSNQYLTITPDSMSVDEYTTFSQTFVLAFAPPAELNPQPAAYNYVLHDVTTDSSIVVYTKLTQLSFKLEGSFSDVFDRTLKYINYDNTHGVSTRFSLLPATYAALYSYTPASAMQTVFNVTVRMRPPNVAIDTLSANDYHSYNLPFIVRNNWQVANTYFVSAVQSAGWAANATSLGLA